MFDTRKPDVASYNGGCWRWYWNWCWDARWRFRRHRAVIFRYSWNCYISLSVSVVAHKTNEGITTTSGWSLRNFAVSENVVLVSRKSWVLGESIEKRFQTYILFVGWLLVFRSVKIAVQTDCY